MEGRDAFTDWPDVKVATIDAADYPWEDFWARLARVVGDAGLDWEVCREPLIESNWRLKSGTECASWPGAQSVLSGLLEEHVQCDAEVRPSPLDMFCSRLDRAIWVLCDAFAPEWENSFEELELRGPQHRELMRRSREIVARRDLSTFLPLMIAARIRMRAPGDYLEVVKAVDEALAVPRLLTDIDRRRVRWAAVQVFGFSLSIGEAVRYVRERLVIPNCTEDLARWKEMMTVTDARCVKDHEKSPGVITVFPHL